jgi:xanthine/CO dehydrogenase XdhC/CoxF family maturation factor
MNFFSHLLPSKGDKGSAEHPVAAGHFPAARKSASTTTSPHTSPPASPRFKSPPPAAQPISLPARAGVDVQSSQQAAAASSTQPTGDRGIEEETRDKLHTQALQTQLHTLKRERAAQDARYVALAAQYQKDKELHESSLDRTAAYVSLLTLQHRACIA